MSATDIFTPTGSTVSISATQTTGSVSLTDPVAGNSPNVRIWNSGASTAFIRWGVGAQTAVTTDLPLGSGQVENFFKGQADTFAAICASGQTATVYFTPGTGI